MRSIVGPTVLLVLCAAPLAAQPTPLDGIDAYAAKALEEWRVPGMAIAVVKDGAVVLAEGWGVRDVRTGAPVDETTVFGIMSTTKAFTAAAMAMLVDEGAVGWDDRVVDHMPSFALPSPYVTREFTIRDLLAHRAGVERGDFLWFASGWTRDEIVTHLRHLEETGRFRETYGYSNNMYIAAGQLISRVSGMTWDRFVDERIFTPLGMISTNTTVDNLHDVGNVAWPHEEVAGEVVVVPFRSLDNEGPGGSINSTALEMAQWLKLQLGGGEHEGRRLVSEENLLETRTPQTVIPGAGGGLDARTATHFRFYGMGWVLSDYRGRALARHGGGIDGLRSEVALMPAEGLGIVVLTNRGDGNGLAGAMVNWILDRHLVGDEAPDWSALLAGYAAQGREAQARRAAAIEAARIAGTTPSLPLDGYTGRYSNAAYGDAWVRLQNGGLTLQLGPALAVDLEHWHHETFRVRWRSRDFGPAFVTFDLDARGEVEGFVPDEDSPLPPFEKAPGA